MAQTILSQTQKQILQILSKDKVFGKIEDEKEAKQVLYNEFIRILHTSVDIGR